MYYKKSFLKKPFVILIISTLLVTPLLPTMSAESRTEYHTMSNVTLTQKNSQTKKILSTCTDNKTVLPVRNSGVSIDIEKLPENSLHSQKIYLNDIKRSQSNRGLDFSWMDFNPAGGTSRNGGFFEGNEASQWSVTKYAWQDGDPFDNTDEYIPEWSSNNQLYSNIRTDEDLNDGTSPKGAWCSAAGENSFWPGSEDSRGWTKCELSFDLADFVDITKPGFCFVHIDNSHYQSKLFCDYRIHAADFDDDRNHVYFNIYLDDGTREWPFCYNAHTSEADMPKNDGWCTAFWDPEYAGCTNPSVMVNDYSTNFIVNYTQGNQMYGYWISQFFNNFGQQFSLRFELYIRLFGEYFDDEYMKFWVDHAGIELCYWYSDPPYEPHSPSPADGAHYVTPTTNLMWYGGDPDDFISPIDNVNYLVYLGTTANPPLIDTIGPFPADNHGPFTFTPPGGLGFNEHYYWRIEAVDAYGVTTSSETWEFYTENNAPSAPDQPTGPSTGWHGTSYSYSTSANDQDNHQIQYGWDWDDGSPIEWTGFYQSGMICTLSHCYEDPGSYNICVKAKDELGGESGWSLPHTVSMDNRPPSPPSTPSGEVSGWHGVSYTYVTSANDPDNDKIKYFFNWGDGSSEWSELHGSGETVELDHCWETPGTYEIKTKAKDEFQAESGFCSPSLFVYMGNRDPDIPTHPNPSHLASAVPIETMLSWEGSDPDGDILHYSVYFDTQNPPGLVQNNITTNNYDPGDLQPNTTYYWQIISYDDWGGSCTGPIWEFTTRLYHKPILTLFNGWTSGIDKTWGTGQDFFTFKIHYQDPDGDYPTIHQVMIDAESYDMQCISPDPADGDYMIRLKGCTLGGGQHFYYFYFYDGTISDPVRYPDNYEWDFTINNPPEPPSVTGPYRIKVQKHYNFSAVSFDADQDSMYFWFDWGDGTNSGWVGPYGSGDTVTASHSWAERGEFNIRVHARDHPHGDLSDNGSMIVKVPSVLRFFGNIFWLWEWWINQPILHQLMDVICFK